MAKDANGAKFGGPSWELLLSYEYEIRCHASFLLLQGGYTLEAALRESWADSTVKDRYFTTPLNFAPQKHRAGEQAYDQEVAPDFKKAKFAKKGDG